ncbi:MULTISPECIES: lipase family protein [Thalassolituus]|jgi:pimeloyl-ACP methyl ester carboxylesterase|uniref:lipase family protein n=1 Tax=Thalassolituus TaxID=187492 RepID=UPI0023F5584E|nr:lipase family protein [Thalassolituus oleivorans]
MDSILEPKNVAEFASDIYILVDALSPKALSSALVTLFGGKMDISLENITSAKTGGPGFIKSTTAFGLMAFGKGAYEGHAFVILRGTKKTFPADWLTNFNLATSRSTRGQLVHDGFNQAFSSIVDQLEKFIKDFASRGITTVHCIGHSLGGGLATLCAEFLEAETRLKPYLYTFGAPRVGMAPFATSLTNSLSYERMYRIYHRTDIVPCVPFWPFVHAPLQEKEEVYDYFQPSPGSFPAIKMHDMKEYVKTIGKQGWSELRGKRDEHFGEQGINRWLNDKASVSFHVTNLEWLDKAISYVVGKCLKAIGMAMSNAFSATFTLMDRLAYILRKGINLATAISDLVLNLIRKMMSMLGMKPILEKADATHAFITRIFQQMSARVGAYCQRALDSVLVNGQGM